MSRDITITTRELSPFEQLVLGLLCEGKTNIRVLLALAFRTHFGDAAFDQLAVACSHLEHGVDGQLLCNREVGPGFFA